MLSLLSLHCFVRREVRGEKSLFFAIVPFHFPLEKNLAEMDLPIGPTKDFPRCVQIGLGLVRKKSRTGDIVQSMSVGTCSSSRTCVRRHSLTFSSDGNQCSERDISILSSPRSLCAIARSLFSQFDPLKSFSICNDRREGCLP